MTNQPVCMMRKGLAQRRHSLSPVRQSPDSQCGQAHRASISGETQSVDCFENPPGQAINAQMSKRRDSVLQCDTVLPNATSVTKHTMERRWKDCQLIQNLVFLWNFNREARRDGKAKKANSNLNSMSNPRTLQF